jgi:hypothetical protein
MRSPVVPRSELESARVERDEWHRRAESALVPPARGRSQRSGLRPQVWLVILTVIALVAVGGAGGARAVQHQQPESEYPSCISRARYEHPIAENRYQELVNALYECGVYHLP